MSWFTNRSVRAKVLAAIAIGGIVTIVITFVGLSSLSNANATMRQFTAKNKQFVALSDMRQSIADMLGALSPDQQKAADAELANAIALYRQGAPSDRGTDLGVIETSITAYRQVRDTTAATAIAAGRVDQYVTIMAAQAQPQLTKATDAIGRLQDKD